MSRKGENNLVNANYNEDEIEARIEYEYQNEESLHEANQLKRPFNKKEHDAKIAKEKAAKVKDERIKSKIEADRIRAEELRIREEQRIISQAIAPVVMPVEDDWEIHVEEKQLCMICMEDVRLCVSCLCIFSCCKEKQHWHVSCVKGIQPLSGKALCPICRVPFVVINDEA